MGRAVFTHADRRYLRLALDLARSARGRTSPNPMVGAVIVRGARIVGRGYHARAGAPHAEAIALQRAGSRARGARLYLNLEPCCHAGRTPPCTDAILAAGIVEVVASMRDPDPRVNGGGFRALRRAGLRVRVGCLAAEARRLNEGFVRYQRTGSPFVTLKAGMTLDGRIATRGGESRWITSPAARAEARRLRARHDAVLVGVGTVLRDDPTLRAPGAGTARVVLDSRLRTPPRSRLLRDARRAPVLVMTRPGASGARRRRLERAGAIVVEVPRAGRRVSLPAALGELGRRGVTSVLIEGGGEVLGSALDARVGHRVALFVAPCLLGGRQATAAFGGRGPARLRQAARLRDAVVRRVGRDMLIEARLTHARDGRRVDGI